MKNVISNNLINFLCPDLEIQKDAASSLISGPSMRHRKEFPSFDVWPDVETQIPSTASCHYTDVNWMKEGLSHINL